MTEEWLEFVVNCRRGKEHEFDIVDGPMAVDQIVFCTEEALKTLHFEGSEKL